MVLLNKTVLMSTQNICLNLWVRKIYNFTLKIFAYLNQWNSNTKSMHRNSQPDRITKCLDMTEKLFKCHKQSIQIKNIIMYIYIWNVCVLTSRNL